MTMTLRQAALTGAILATASASPAFAAEAVSPIQISATITTNCHVSTDPLRFENVDVTGPGANDVATGALSVTCTNGAPWRVGIAVGDFSGATRTMTDPATGLGFDYTLYTSTARTEIWGDGLTASTATMNGLGTGMLERRSFSAQISGGQEALPAGTYSEIILLTVTY